MKNSYFWAIFGIYYQIPMYADFWCFFIEQPERSKKNIFWDLQEASRKASGWLLVRSIFQYVLIMKKLCSIWPKM